MCENPAVAERWEADRFANVILPDGETREVRVVEGHLFVCEGCCCGNADKGVPEVPRAAFKKEWKERGIRRRVHLSISGCLGPCAVANVVIHLEGVGGCARGRAESRGRLTNRGEPDDPTHRQYEAAQRAELVFASCAMSSARTLSESSFCHKRRRPSCRRPGRDNHWVATLERLVTAKGLADSPELDARKEAWADTYRHTPHGKPVVLPPTD